jgi:hypothetical protein
MHREQAGELLKKLCLAWGQDLEPERAKLYFEFLCDLDEAVGLGAVDRAISKERFFPSVGTLQSHVEAISPSAEGMPNAGAYGPVTSQTNDLTDLVQLARKHEWLVKMRDEEYAEYLEQYQKAMWAKHLDSRLRRT